MFASASHPLRDARVPSESNSLRQSWSDPRGGVHHLATAATVNGCLPTLWLLSVDDQERSTLIVAVTRIVSHPGSSGFCPFAGSLGQRSRSLAAESDSCDVDRLVGSRAGSNSHSYS